MHNSQDDMSYSFTQNNMAGVGGASVLTSWQPAGSDAIAAQKHCLHASI